MGLVSILLSALAVICAGIGVLLTPFPVLGLIFAFGGPALAIIGAMLGGNAMSRAKRAGQTDEAARIGVILNALAFVPSVLVALTCGVCNALFTTGNVQFQRNVRFGVNPFDPDAGVRGLPPPQRADKPEPGDPQPDQPQSPEPGQQRAPRQDRPNTPRGSEPKPGEPPREPPPAEPQREPPGGALPPPPLPAGPGR